MRLIAASNRDLAQMVEDRTFREDLYCRLNVFPIEMPPLRQRREDIPVLARHFMQLHARANNRSITAIEPDGLAASRRPFTRLEIRASTNANDGLPPPPPEPPRTSVAIFDEMAIFAVQ